MSRKSLTRWHWNKDLKEIQKLVMCIFGGRDFPGGANSIRKGSEVMGRGAWNMRSEKSQEASSDNALWLRVQTLAFTHDLNRWRFSSREVTFKSVENRLQRAKAKARKSARRLLQWWWWWLGPEKEQWREWEMVKSGVILKVEPTKCVDSLELGCMRERN